MKNYIFLFFSFCALAIYLNLFKVTRKKFRIISLQKHAAQVSNFIVKHRCMYTQKNQVHLMQKRIYEPDY